jgi:hypothetical protein
MPKGERWIARCRSCGRTGVPVRRPQAGEAPEGPEQCPFCGQNQGWDLLQPAGMSADIPAPAAVPEPADAKHKSRLERLLGK